MPSSACEEKLTATGGPLAVNAAVSGGSITANSGSAITEGVGGFFNTGGLLQTTSVSAQRLNGANTVSNFNATNTACGIFILKTAATEISTLSLHDALPILTVTNTRAVTTTGTIT